MSLMTRTKLMAGLLSAVLDQPVYTDRAAPKQRKKKKSSELKKRLKKKRAANKSRNRNRR